MDEDQVDSLIERIGNVNKVTGMFDPSPDDEDDDDDDDDDAEE